MSDVTHSVDESARPRAAIPTGEPERVQELVRREVAGLLTLHESKIDLEYRVKRYRELADRYRAVRAEEAALRKQMRELNLPPQLLRTMKEE